MNKILYILFFIAFCYGGTFKGTSNFYNYKFKDKIIHLVLMTGYHILIVVQLYAAISYLFFEFSSSVLLIFILCTGAGGLASMIILSIVELIKKHNKNNDN